MSFNMEIEILHRKIVDILSPLIGFIALILALLSIPVFLALLIGKFVGVLK